MQGQGSREGKRIANRARGLEARRMVSGSRGVFLWSFAV